MTSITQPLHLDGGDDPAAVLAYARAEKQAEDQAARNVMRAAARWAALHSADSLVGPVDEWHEHALPLGGEGCPEVAEFAVVEFAAALGKTTAAGRMYLSKAVEARYRLTRCWKQLEAGVLPAWKLGIIAEQTMTLPKPRRSWTSTSRPWHTRSGSRSSSGSSSRRSPGSTPTAPKPNAPRPPRPATSTYGWTRSPP